MSPWPCRRFVDLIGIELPIVQAPMAGAQNGELAIEVARAGGLGSIPCAMLSLEEIAKATEAYRNASAAPINLNFFCHEPPRPSEDTARAWAERLVCYDREWGIDRSKTSAGPARKPFDAPMADLVEALRPEVVSFHFGLPQESLLARVKGAGAIVLASATSVEEARWLESRGCDVIIAQGAEAGGHRGNFLSQDMGTQTGTFALVPQVVDAVRVPVVAAGGIADGRGMAAALVLGASAVQMGTVYLLTPESTVAAVYRRALEGAPPDGTVITNVFTGRPARSLVNRFIRELGPMAREVPDFPEAASFVGPLRQRAEASGSADFSPLWCGQSVNLAPRGSAHEVTRRVATDARNHLKRMATNLGDGG